MENTNINCESSSVQTHLKIIQDVIRRMAENSRSCKVWCVTLVSATLVLLAQTGNPQNVLLALAPAVLFLILDTYYLALERGFRNAYDAFVGKLHSSDVTLADLYVVKPNGAISRPVPTVPAIFFNLAFLSHGSGYGSPSPHCHRSLTLW